MDPGPNEGAPTGTAIPLRAGDGQLTRRSVLRRGSFLIVAASGLLGRLVGFAPSAAAVVISCITATPVNCVLDCIGPCHSYQSICYNDPPDKRICKCTCNAGPGRCTPPFFRAKGTCSNSHTKQTCCCISC